MSLIQKTIDSPVSYCEFDSIEVKQPTELESKRIIEEAYIEYKKLNLPRCAVDDLYHALGNILIAFITVKQIYRIPNGCCSNPECEVNRFYRLVAEKLGVI